MEIDEAAVNEVGLQVSKWLKRLQNEGSEALKEMKMWDKAKLRETRDWIQANVPAKERRANLLAVETALIDELKDKRALPTKRQFLKFHFANKTASKLLLRNVLRDPEVYTLHPQPELAAAIMVMDHFNPQLQAYLCNFAVAARELDLEKALQDDLSNCRCRSAMWKLLPDDLNQQGHLLTVDSRNLKWPQLKFLVTKGKKFRLEADTDTVFVCVLVLQKIWRFFHEAF